MANIDFVSNYPKSLFSYIAVVGGNCSIFVCSSSSRKSGVASFKVLQGDDEWSSNRSVFTRNCVIDKALRERITKKIFSSVKSIILKIKL